MICSRAEIDHRAEESAANARLIAAAPALYEALFDYVSEYGSTPDGKDDGTWPEDEVRLLEQAHAALRKARGEP